MIAKKVNSIKESLSNFKIIKQAYRWKFRQFRPKVSLIIENRRFIIKTVENTLELEKALNLRYEVFYKEALKKSSFVHIDVDKYDLICDHLIIIDKEIDQVIGTYRLISSTFSEKFYSETEFVMDKVKNASGIKLELGRACVDRRYRNGLAIALLWKGVSEYMKKVEAKYLFGCSSISTTNIVEVSLIYKYIKELHLSADNFRVFPKPKYKVKELNYYQEAFDKYNINTKAIADFIPPLLKSYFKAGSVICGEPALDKKFKCADFFTILDIDTLSGAYDKKYKSTNA